MKEIRCLSELIELRQKIQNDLGEYLAEEFYGLYEYLSNGEKIENFLLMPYQSIIILENEEELVKVIENKIELEFTEEVNLKGKVILRIGLRNMDDIQLHYTIFECNMMEGEIP